MSERPNDARDGLIKEPEAGPPIDDEAMDLEAEGAVTPGGPDEGFDERLEESEVAEEAAAASQGEAAAKAAEAEVQREHAMRPSERRAARAAERTQIPIDPALRIKDPASALFVLVTIVVFGLIVLNGLVLGKGGLLTPLPTPGPLPTPIVTPAPTAAPAISPSPTAVPTVEPSPTAAS